MLSLRPIITKNCILLDLIKQQTRNTFILKRRWPPTLAKKRSNPIKFRGRHFVYDLVQDTNIIKQPDIKIILTQFVDGVGNIGEILNERPNRAYNKYLLPGFAVYATPENLKKYEQYKDLSQASQKYSSPYVSKTILELSKIVLRIEMNKVEPWILEPWHVKAAFRMSNFIVPEDAIELPPQQIKGPDLSLHDKEFLVTVTINNREKVNVRCTIFHYGNYVEDEFEESVTKIQREPLFPEQADLIKEMQEKWNVK